MLHLQYFQAMEAAGAALVNQQNGELAFRVFSFEDALCFNELQRHNYYSVILVLAGDFELQVELEQHKVSSKAIICISPYQPYAIESAAGIRGVVLNFHSDFFCTYRHHNEIPTEGVLFHNIFQPTFFKLPNEKPLLTILDQMTQEITEESIGQHEQLVSYLKIFLISLIRIKKRNAQEEVMTAQIPQTVQDLVDNIELNYRNKHAAKDYAQMLHLSTSALGKLVRKHFGKTLTNLVAERIMVEAKRELYLTSKSVKEISFLLGYKDEYYFSRFFKKHAGISPNVYRKTVGFAKAESLP